MFAVPALAERYDSPFGYSMDLPDGWLPLNAETYSVIAAAISEEHLAPLGLTADMAASTIEAAAAQGREYLFSRDGSANASVQVIRQSATEEQLVQSAEAARLSFEQIGATDAVVGSAKFGENEFRAIVCTLMGAVVANYLCASGEVTYVIAFANTSVEDVSLMLSFAVFPPGAEETAPANAVFALDGALKEPRG
jgi:hypothetical protein